MPTSKHSKPKLSKRLLELIREHGDKITDLLPFGAHAKGRKHGPKKHAKGASLQGARRGKKLPGNAGKFASPAVANYSTPASFARVENNTSFLSPEHQVTHPNLGIAGVRVSFSQPLETVYPGAMSNTPTQWYSGFWQGTAGPATSWPAVPTPPGIGSLTNMYIDLNPGTGFLGGPLSTIASRYLKYRFTDLVVTYTTAVGTNTGGTFGMCIVDDPALVATVATNFNSVREITPNVIAPYRIPEATLAWKSRNTTLYYCDNTEYIAPGDAGGEANARQCIQATLVGIDSGTLAGFPGSGLNSFTFMGYATISGAVEFYEPIPPTSVPSTAYERRAVEDLLRQLRHIDNVPQRSMAPPKRAVITVGQQPGDDEGFHREVVPPDKVQDQDTSVYLCPSGVERPQFEPQRPPITSAVSRGEPSCAPLPTVSFRR
jgi:hypothetical protein